MAIGGTYLNYNKSLPGAYINFLSKSKTVSSLGDRGIVALALDLNWGEENKIITITLEDFQKNLIKILGYDFTHKSMTNLREIFKNASVVKLFRLGSGQKASTTIGNLIVTAKYAGSRGNDFKVKIVKNIDDNSYTVLSYLDNRLIDESVATEIKDLKNNDFLEFSGTGELKVNAGQNLTGGVDNFAINSDYIKFLELIEKESFNTLIYDGNNESTKALFESFTKRLRNEEGVKITTILHNYSKADFEGIISLKNESKFIYWLAGANAGAKVNESLTNKVYDGEYTFETKFNTSQMKEAIENGEILFFSDGTQIKVLKDINSFTSFNPEKTSDFCNNQVIRVLDSIANDILKIFNSNYLGKVQNNTLGRDMFKSEIIDYINYLQSINAVENFSSEDIKIEQGKEKSDVIVNLYVMPIASVEKLYMQCIIE